MRTEYRLKIPLSRACCVSQVWETELSYFSQSLEEIGTTLGVYKPVTCKKVAQCLELC